jgi:tetratricopeptide (TPR) repeat protein
MNMTLRRVRFPVALAAVSLVALAVRVVYLLQLSGSPLLSVLMGDGRQYDEWAQRIAGGQWIGTDVFYQTPLYPYALAVVYWGAGHSLGLVRALQAVMGAASCVLLGLAGRRFFSGRVGVVAALLLAVYPPAIFFDGLIQKSSLDIFLVTAVLALLGEFQDRLQWRWLVAAGIATAALVLNRENARVFYPVIGAWLLFVPRDAPGRRRAGWAAAFLAASFAVLLPVGLRNYRVGGEFLLSTSQLGPNFFIGNNPRASGSYEPLVPGRGDAAYERADATRLASSAAGRPLSPGEVSDYWLGRSWSYIRNQPFDWLALLGKKTVLTFNAAEIPDTESIEAYADYSPMLRGMLWLTFGLMLPAGVLGGWASRRQWRRLSILYGMFAGLAVSVAAFYVVARYRHPLVPILLPFSAAGVCALWDMVRRGPAPTAGARPERVAAKKPATARQRPSWPGWTRQWLPGLAAATVVAVAANLPMKVVHDETYLNLGSVLLQAGRAPESIPVLVKAVAVDPSYWAPHLNLGLAYRDTGEPQAALEELSTAVRLRPDSAEAQSALGLLLRGAGRTDEGLEHLRESARLAPDSVEAHSNLGLALMEAGRVSEAIAEDRRAVSLGPGAPGPHNNLGGALQQAGDLQQAMAEYRKALALAPDYADAHGNLALALASVREYDEAFRHFREVIRLQPRSYAARITFGNVLCEAGRFDDGIGQYQEAARLAPDSLDAPYLVAQAYARSGRFAEAAASLETALGLANASGRTAAARQITEALRQTRTLMGRPAR